MGKRDKRNKKRVTWNDKKKSKNKFEKICNSINSLKLADKIITTIIKSHGKDSKDNKESKINIKLPVQLKEEYKNLFGNKYPDSKEDLGFILEIIGIQYNRIIKTENIDEFLLNNLKKATFNLSQIINYFVYDPELIKLIKVLETLNIVEDKETVSEDYLKIELENIYSRLRKSEHKLYILITNRLKSNNIQSRYIEEYNKYLENKMEEQKIETKDNKEEQIIDEKELIDQVLNELDNLVI
jgi:hypothetical protein